MEKLPICVCTKNECEKKSKYLTVNKLVQIKLCISNIIELDLSSSKLKEIPEFIESLEKLTKINFSSNELSQLPTSFVKLNQLTYINISYNLFSKLPECIISGISSLEILDISHNLLNSINFKPLSINNLKMLNISNNPNLSSFPQWLWSPECKSLKSLDISFTKCLENLEPDPYMNMYGIANNLSYLNISNTNSQAHNLEFIKHLKHLKNVIFDNIESLKNNGNYLNDIPLIFNYRFKFVTSLSMKNINLSSIRKEIYFILPNLVNLDLSKNEIFSLPETISKMTKLEFCDFSDNQILSVPESFKSLKKMKKMVLSCNNLSKLPNIFDDMIDLEWLDLYNNKLITCPSLDKNSNIKFLDCEQNNFSVKNKFYRRLLDNLRKELAQNNRLIGPVSNDEPDVLDSNEFNDNSSSSSLYSTTFNSSTSSITDNFIDSNFVEDLWEENNYKVFSEEFDPKDFEQSLKEELSKIKLVNNEKRSVIKNQSIHFGIEHYFRPSDDHSKISYRTNYNLMK